MVSSHPLNLLLIMCKAIIDEARQSFIKMAVIIARALLGQHDEFLHISIWQICFITIDISLPDSSFFLKQHVLIGKTKTPNLHKWLVFPSLYKTQCQLTHLLQFSATIYCL